MSLSDNPGHSNTAYLKGYYYLFNVVIMLFLLTGCMIGRGDKDSLPSADPMATSFADQPFFKAKRNISFEDKGKLILVEGNQCAEHEQGTAPATMLIMVDMPVYVNRGSVILNGWDLRYLNKDQEVRTMRAEITHSKLVVGTNGSSALVFEVAGELSDQDQKDAFEFCIYYSGIGFNSAWIDARIEGDYNGIDNWAMQSTAEGPTATLESVWKDGALKGNDSIAVLPRGFDFQYENKFECEWRILPCRWKDPVDYQLRQAAYSLFLTKESANPNGNPHWMTQTIFKDNRPRAYRVKTRSALIGGNSVKLRADFLPLNPQSGKTDICRHGVDGIVRTEVYRINELPFDYAVPLLSGWDLNFECHEQRIQRAGIWLHDIHFDPDSRELKYKISSILRDKDGAPGFNSRHRVSILGLNRSTIPPLTSRPAPEIKIKLRKQ